MSVDANVVEAVNSSSRIEFKRYYEIALKSSNETKYWFCIIRYGFEVRDEVLNELLKECDVISKILATSVITIEENV